jgi:SAM-dependent methyltransferase
MSMQAILRHLRNPKALPALVWKNVLFPFTPLGKEMRWDRRLGIDTTGFIPPPDLGLVNDAEKDGGVNNSTPPGIATFLISQLLPRAKGFTFLDIGSGKGRVLLIASRFPFSRVVGFERSQQMNEIAACNVKQFAKHYPDMLTVEIVGGDATRHPLPDGPLVIYLANPFGRKTMRDLVASVKASYQQSPRKIICVYYNALFADEFSQLGIFPVQKTVNVPLDPTDRYTYLNLPIMMFETADA